MPNPRIAALKRKEKTSWQVKHLSGGYKGRTFFYPSLAAARLEACWQADFNNVVTAIYPPQYGADSMPRYEVTKRAPDGTYLGAVAGMGRHRGTWDSDHSRSAAYRHARTLRQADPINRYTVEPTA